MNELKPRRGCCEYCVSCSGVENCKKCGATLTPAPDLPEGYSEDENGHLIDPHGAMTAWENQDGLMTMLAKPWDVEAVISWLKRRGRDE